MIWVYYTIAQLVAWLFFWLPPWAYTFGHVKDPIPVGLMIAFVLCMTKAWTDADQPSIKPLPERPRIDEWLMPFDALFGDREDGASGRYAYGSWSGAYNPNGTRWLAFCWNCRNWMANYNYITWLWKSAPPLIVKEYGNGHQLKLGWQQRYGCNVMVCSFW